MGLKQGSFLVKLTTCCCARRAW